MLMMLGYINEIERRQFLTNNLPNQKENL
jgi:hypothetical protein